MNIYEEDRFPWLRSEKRFIQQALSAKKKVLGICLGAQLLADALGAKVFPNRCREIGWFPVNQEPGANHLPTGSILPVAFEAFHWHSETFDLPPGARRLYRSEACENQAFVFGNRVHAFQFHLETTREIAEKLIAFGSDGLLERQYIQTASKILEDESCFSKINQLMAAVLESVVA